MVFLVVMYRCERWTIKKAEHQRIHAFRLWCWRTLLRVPWTARRSNQSILKEINPEYSLEGLMLRLKLLILWPPDAKSWLSGKDPDVGRGWGQEEKGTKENKMVGWHHQFNGQESEKKNKTNQTKKKNLHKLWKIMKEREAWCSPWGGKESDRI